MTVVLREAMLNSHSKLRITSGEISNNGIGDSWWFRECHYIDRDAELTL